ncbi:MAG: hypothetical protein ACJA17_000057 [Polaribacter sp.]|jgi:hypothetical protein
MMKSPKMLGVIISTILFFSCASPLDFDQLNQYSPNQAVSVPFITFTINDTNFETPISPALVPSIFKKSDFKIFYGTFLKERVVQLEFDFEIKNDINRNFTVEIILRAADFDDSNSLTDGREIHRIALNVKASSQDFTENVFITKADFPDIVNFLSVEIKLTLQDDTIPIDSIDAGELKFKSGLTVYLKGAL